MKKIAMIPARYAATRFPFKLMQPLGEKTVIRQTYDNTLATGLFDDVVVITDSDIIFDEIKNHGGKAIMSINSHESGSDRIAEAAADMEVDIILNVQGDEPFVHTETLRQILAAFDDKSVQVASVMKKFTDMDLVKDPNYVKVVVDKDLNALFFSRAPIPYLRDEQFVPTYFEHIGVYAFRKQALLNFTQWPLSDLERAEKLEQLRYLENGVSIKMVITDHTGVKIDVPADLEKAVQFLQSREAI
jgi:3-deoxy-manno-octulosonate cytidylyltransferase (CMP-KDO synthetase)